MCGNARFKQLVCLSIVTILLGAATGHGQIWTGNGDGETWLDGSNWDAGIAPQVSGDFATFDGNFGVVQRPIQIDGPVTVSGIDLINGPGDVRISDDEPFNPSFGFELDAGGAASTVKLNAAPGTTSLVFDESLQSLTLGDDLEVHHAGALNNLFAIQSSIFGSHSVSLMPGTGRAELTGNFNGLNHLTADIEARFGDFNPDGSLDLFQVNGDLAIGPSSKTVMRAMVVGLGNLVLDGRLLLEPETTLVRGGDLIGSGVLDVQPFGHVQVAGNAVAFSGATRVVDGTLSVGTPLGGPPGQVTMLGHAAIGTVNNGYAAWTDPAVQVDPSVANPGSVGISIEVPNYSGVIDTNFNNGVDNAFRLGSTALGSVDAASVVIPFDNGVTAPAYFMGGHGRLDVFAGLSDSPLSGISTALIMPQFPTARFGLNSASEGAIALHAASSFTGGVLVEQGQLELQHIAAVAAAAGLDVVAPNTVFSGGNYQHGTIVVDPALLGGYLGPAPNLLGGAIGFTSPFVLGALPTATGGVGPGVYDASGFGGGSTNSSILGLGGNSAVVQDPTFPFQDLLSASGDPVILVVTDRASVTLATANFHSGGTAVVGESTLEVSNSNQLGPGPLNIADGATLRVAASTTFGNELDMHDATPFGSSRIAVVPGAVAEFKGNMSTAAAQGATFHKTGGGRLIFDPSAPWQPLAQENSWGLRLTEGAVFLHQLPEYDPNFSTWGTGPLVFDGSTVVDLAITATTVANAIQPDNFGFNVMHSSPNSTANVLVDAGTTLYLAGVNNRNEIFGRIDKFGPGTMWFGGDASGGAAVGARYDGRGDLNVVEGTVRFGNVPGTNDLARAFPNDIVLRLQDQTLMIKEQDQAGHVQSLFVNDFSGGGTVQMALFGGASPLGDGSLNVDLDAYGTFAVNGRLEKLGDAPLRFSAQPGATISLAAGAILGIGDGTVEVDGSGIDPFTDTVTGDSLHIENNAANEGFRVTAGATRVQSVLGSGKTRVDAGATLQIATPLAQQGVFDVKGTIAAPGIAVTNLLTGDGQVTGDVALNSGSLAPNDDVNPLTPTPATLKIGGNVTAGAGTEINIDVSGASFTNDMVDIGGSAMLLGSALTVDVHSPFNSLGTSSHLIMSAAAGVVFPFSSTPNPGDYLGAGVEFAAITYAAGGNVIVDLTQTAYADFNDDGLVNSLDLVIWQTNYGTSGSGIHSLGDADLDGDVDGRDFLVWQRQFGTTFATLPSITPVNVPEPSALVIALALAQALVWQTRRGRWPLA